MSQFAPPAEAVPPIDLPYPDVPFGEAFRRYWKKGLTFTGRASRAEYWKLVLINGGIGVVVYILFLIGLAASASQYDDGYGGAGMGGFAIFMLVLIWIWGLANLVPGIALAVRRFHDGNHSGLVWFVALIPFVGGFIQLYFLAQQSNPYGARFDVPAAGAGTAPLLPPPAAPGWTPDPPAPASPTWAAAPAPAPAFAPQAAPVPAWAPPPVPESAPTTSWAPVQAPVPARAPAAPDLDATQLRTPAPAGGLSVVLSDGRSLPASGTLVFGRDPISDQLHPGATLVPIADPAKSMSKTHALLELVDGRLRVTDLHSTNGTTVTTAAGAQVALAAGHPRAVGAGDTLAFGDYVVRLAAD